MQKRKINKDRNELTKLFKGVGVEVGVERAHYSKVITETADFLHGVDPLIKYKGYREHVPQVKLDGFYDEVIERMNGKSYAHIREYSHEAVKRFKDNTLDFVYIDANHEFESVIEDMEIWFPKLKLGGILSGHDYVERKGQNVIGAVDSFCKLYDIKDLFIFTGDRSPSWMLKK